MYQQWYYENNKDEITQYKKAYNKKNKNKIAEEQKLYYENNKEKIKSYKKQYYLDNKDKISEKQKLYYENNKEVIAEKEKQYYDKNKETILVKNKQYYEENKEIVLEKNSAYRKEHKTEITEKQKERLEVDINFKLSCRLRTRLSGALKNNRKCGSAVSDLGCSISELKIWLEQQFYNHSYTGEPMTWENYGEWHIDHILPLSKFDLTDKTQLLKACNWFNLQPLWAEDNLKKSDKTKQ